MATTWAELDAGSRGGPDHQSRTRAVVCKASQQSHDRGTRREPRGVRLPSKGGRGSNRRRGSAYPVTSDTDNWQRCTGVGVALILALPTSIIPTVAVILLLSLLELW